MPTPPLTDDVRELLAKPNPAVMATVRKDGQPVTVATWYVFDGDTDRILVNLAEERTRVTHLRNDPRVAMTILDEKSWYTHVSIQGHVAELVDDVDLSDVDRVSRQYTGQPYPVRNQKRISAWVEIDRWFGWNTGD
jgi:PPOX class probable F420-dependent enzyme